MSTDRRWAARAFLAVSFIPTVFVACATGNQVETAASSEGAGGRPSPSTSSNGGSGGGSGGSGGTLPMGMVGSSCTTNDDCVVGTCTAVGDKKYCTVPCPPDCPNGTYCSLVNGDAICIPDLGQQCDVCTSAASCPMPTDQCFKAPLGDSFCARDCTAAGLCPNGFTCMNGDAYLGGGSGSGGGMDGGVPDSGADAGNDAGKDAGDGGPKPPPVPTKWCVPNSGASCPCTTERDGVSHDCHNVNTFGDCAGKETCDGKLGKWQGCTASTPKAETCNNTDDNCNSKVDDGDPNALCASGGPPPPNSGWKCTAGTCAIGACSPGWTAYPPGPLANGCTCPVDVSEPNGSCATAKDVGMVNDASGSVLMQGTLSADSDVDFWKFNAVDIDEMTTNSYHVSIDFTGPTPNTEFLMDVIRGATCADIPSGPSTSLISYDWCVDGTAANGGEKTCGNSDGLTHCNDNSSAYFVRVYRKPGVPKTCTQYVIKATAQGGDSCDFTTQCP
jgi:hypothetical protein